jgi:type II secretory pathway predicted ATPase ExeA
VYLEFFNFTRPPFANTADPAFFYPSAAHREAMATLRYGISERKGLCVLTGPVGSGKTMLLRKLIQEHPEFHTVLLANPWLDERELFARLLREWGNGGDVGGEPLEQLHAALLAQVQQAEQAEQARFVLLADEAHLLSKTTLEAIRLLLNLEEERGKLVQIVLSGQEELAAILRQHRLRPLLQRVALVEHLQAFDLDDTIGYVQHRLRVAGGDPYIFPRPCLEWIHRESRGIPRLINQICDHALIFAFGRQSRTVERQDVEAALAKLPLGTTFLEPEPEAEASEALRAELRTQPPPAAAPEPVAAASAATTEAPAPEPPQAEPIAPAADVLGLAGMRPAAGVGVDPGAAPVPASTFPDGSDPAAGQRKGKGWIVQIASIVVALLLGAGVAWWWLTQKVPAERSVASTPAAQEGTSPVPATIPQRGSGDGAPSSSAGRPAPSAPLSSPTETAAAERDGGERYPTALPLPVASRFTEVTVADAKGLLAAISNHFGADNTTVRDLFAAMNPGIVIEGITPNTRVRLPQLRRNEMIVTDARGRLYIYYATVADDQLAATVKQRIAPLGVQTAQFPAVVAGQTAFRIYLGPFSTRDEAARIVELLRFTFLPLLERGEAASGS